MEILSYLCRHLLLVLNYFKLEDAGTVFVRGAKDKGDVKNTDGLEKAYQLGTAI